MSVSVISKPTTKKTDAKSQQFSWLNVIKKQRSIFILGCKGQERYELFSSCLSPSNCLQEVWRNLQVDMTYVLYPSLTNELYVKGENEQIERCENLINEKKDVVLFVPVDPSQLPNGSLIVLPPALLEKELPAVMTDSLFHNERTEFVWVEAFPYGKSESYNALLHLEHQYNIHKHVHYAFIESRRKFAYTDLDTQQEAIEVAKQSYLKQGYGKTIATIHSQISPFSLLSLITEDVQHTDRLIQEMLQVVEMNERYYERFFEDDYLDIIADLRLPEMLEQVFDYQALMRVSGNTVFDIWLHQMDELVSRQLHTQIQKLLIRDLQIDRVYPLGNYQKVLDHLLLSEWTNFIKDLSQEREEAKSITKNLDPVQYATTIKEVKVQLKQKITIYIEKHLYNELHNHIQMVYNLWGKK